MRNRRWVGRPSWGLALVLVGVLLGIPIRSFGKVAQGRQLEIFKMGVAAASLAVAETDTATLSNPHGGVYNPATAVACQGTQIHSLHTHFSDDIDLFSLGIVQAIAEHWTLGGAWTQYQVSEIPITAVDTATATQDIATNRTSYSTHAFTGFLATQLDPYWEIGVSVTGLMSRLASDSKSTGYGFSVAPGIRTQILPTVALGAYVENAVSTMAWQSGTTETFSRTIHVAGESTFDALITSVDYAFSPSKVGNGDVKVGIRYPLFSFLTVAAGAYPSHLNCGLGFRLGTIAIDYAYLGGGQDVLDSGSRITFGVRV